MQSTEKKTSTCFPPHAVRDCEKIKNQTRNRIVLQMHPFKSPANLKESHWNSTLSAFVDIIIIFLPKALFFFFKPSSLHLKVSTLPIYTWQKAELRELLTARLSLSAALSLLWKETMPLFRCGCRASLIGCAAFLLYSRASDQSVLTGRGALWATERDKCLAGTGAHLKRGSGNTPPNQPPRLQISPSPLWWISM